MIICEQTRLRAVVLVGCFNSLSRLDSLAFSVHQKSAYVTVSSWPRFAQNLMLYGSSSRWSDDFNASCFFYLRHLNVGTDVFTRSKPTYTQDMSAVCAFFDLELDYCES